MGIGGGFLLVPMLIYFLRMPTATVIGTAAALTTVTMAVATVMHAHRSSGRRDPGADPDDRRRVGAQFGAPAAQNLPAERLRFLLGLLIMAVGFRFGYGLIARPGEIYSVHAIGTGL